MTKTFNLWFFIMCAVLILSSCRSLKTPIIVKNAPIEEYKYVFITPTKELTSSIGNTYSGQYSVTSSTVGVYGGQYSITSSTGGGYGVTATKSVNPSDVISGKLINGFIVLPELQSELNDKTLIVNYGESGRRNRGLGYTIEVTIQFISAKTHELVCSCTAEGQGATEADDIRQAIRRALSGLFGDE